VAATRIIPGPDQGDAEIVVLGIELHEELIVVDIATTMIAAVRRPTPRNKLPLVKVEDDLGNSYAGVSLEKYSSGWSGNAPAAHYAYEARPHIAPDARFLRITFRSMYRDDHSVVVAI
jgi:hypothetical protein